MTHLIVLLALATVSAALIFGGLVYLTYRSTVA